MHVDTVFHSNATMTEPDTAFHSNATMTEPGRKYMYITYNYNVNLQHNRV